MIETKLEIEIKVGDTVIPEDYPQLASKVASIEPFCGGLVFVLENGTKYTKEELKD